MKEEKKQKPKFVITPPHQKQDQLLDDLDKMLAGEDVFSKNGKEKTEKKAFFKKLRVEMKRLCNETDKEFSKQLLRRMAENAVTVIEMLEMEMKKDIYARDAEVAGQLINQVVNIVDKINHINREEKKVELAEKKLSFEEQRFSNILPGPQKGGKVINNIVAVGNTRELIDLLKEHSDSIPEVPKTIDAEDSKVEIIEDANTDTGSESS